ncbi:MAG: hypothetical protein IPG02_02365 [Ignavibacteria bacterium]|nr:hypothetical protein [Ignavibacteria bacterium]
MGINLGFGTPYSTALETDYVEGGLKVLIFTMSATARIKESVLSYSYDSFTESSKNSLLGNWNNIFAPKLGMRISASLPFLEVSYFETLDTSGHYYSPEIVRNQITGEPMKNNVIRGSYFDFELRLDNVVVLNSNYAKFYFARRFGEYHLGFTGRELKYKDISFDFRVNCTFPGKRDYQILLESLIDFETSKSGRRIVAIGPTIRLGKTQSNPSDSLLHSLICVSR